MVVCVRCACVGFIHETLVIVHGVNSVKMTLTVDSVLIDVVDSVNARS
jgi:hypothetical protein